MRRSAVLLIVSATILAVCALPRRAAAGGLEYVGAGATALGRGGAVTARADDPMVLAYNPAGLAELRGSQLLFDLNLASMQACVDPIGFYGWGNYGGGHGVRLTDSRTGERQLLNLGDPTKLGAAEKRYYTQPYDTVCMQQHTVPIPQLIATMRVSDKLGIGFGMVFPAATPQGQWGGDNGLIRDAQGQLRPAATRYMLMNTATLGLFPTLGFGYRLSKALRIGGAFEWGMVWVDTTTMASMASGTDLTSDIIAHVRGRDLFIPGFTGSVHLVPNDSLDIVAAFKYQDAVHASGALDLTTSEFSAAGRRYVNRDLVVNSINQNMPWKLRVGARYSERLAPRPDGTGKGQRGMFLKEALHDALQDERWDVELDAEYQINSRNQFQEIDYKPGQQVNFLAADGSPGTPAVFPDPSQINTKIQKRWKDQISLRAGGTYNILPGFFAVSAGAHYENRGVDPAYMQIDYWPLQRLGLHAGVTLRVARSTDIVFSYAHIFQETLVVGAPDQLDAHTIYTNYVAGQPITNIDRTVGTQLSRTDKLPLAIEKNPGHIDGSARLTQVVTKTSGDQPPWIVNSGTYRSGLDILAIGVHTHF